MSSASDTPPMTGYVSGDVIGKKYSLKRVIGEGGMGSVWIAENLDLAADVALKLIRADVAEAGANERFLSEARLAARLKHPAIVSVFDFGKTEKEEPFIVMELLQGETLGRYLARLGSVDPTELLKMLLPIIEALHLAHGHNVVHRDLKPDNIFIARSDTGEIQPKLLDFGIAKLKGTSAFKATKLTQAGTLIGSPDYMSPEQARGEADLDARSDVWALCVLAYECLVGKPPFHGDNYNALLWAIIHDEPVPSTVYQAGDSELWRLLKRGFAKDRNDRWNDAKQLGESFAHWLESNGVSEDICHRSLHASWLPTERPTRPEIAAPFFPLTPTAPPPPGYPAGGSGPASGMPPGASYQASPEHSFPPQAMSLPASGSPPPLEHPTGVEFRAASSSHSALTTPTRAMVWRPHTRSLWFAAVGVLTLVAAVVLSNSGVRTPMSNQVLTPQQVQPLQAAGARPFIPAPNRSWKVDPPIGEASSSTEKNGKKAQSSAKGGTDSSESFSKRNRKKKRRRTAKGRTLRVRDLPEISTPSENALKLSAPEKKKPNRAKPKKVRRRRRPQTNSSKKSKSSKKTNEPFDFGI